MTAQQAQEIAAAYTNPRVQPWYQELMDDIVLAAKNQETKLFIKWEGEDTGDDTNKRFLESEGYIVGDNFISWAEPAPEKKEEPDLHWQSDILERINSCKACGYASYHCAHLLNEHQVKFLEQRGYTISFGVAPQFGTIISWDSNTPSA